MNKEKRTIQQNSALHLYFRWIAEALNSAGYDLKKVIDCFKDGVEISWTEIMVKEILWREIQKVMYNKQSTIELSKQEEIDKIHDVLNRFLGERLGIDYIPFPSQEFLDEKLKKYDKKI